MIYMDPPYGVKFGSNFQPFVRKRDVTHNDDDDMTREPEMVQAYRDTWEVGLHSYLTYHSRPPVARPASFWHPSGSLFVQISDENLHHVREVMDEVFGAENFVCIITFKKTEGLAVIKAIKSSLITCSGTARISLEVSSVDITQAGARESDQVSYDQVELADGQEGR